jgi:drug/metabolite transporter (DMT)-like permease
MKRAGAVLCIVVGSTLAIVLVVELVVSIPRRSFAPSWFWLRGILGLGILSIAAGFLLWRKTE